LAESVISLITLVIVGLVSANAFARINSATYSNEPTIIAGAYGTIALSAIVPLALAVILSALLQGVIVLEVSRGTLGEKQTFRQLRARGRGRFGALVGYTVLLTIAATLFLALIVGVIIVLVATLGTAGIVLGVLVAILAGLAITVGFYWLSTKLSLVPSAIMLERLSIRQAIARSWTLTRGYFWRTLGIQFLVGAILSFVSQVISVPLRLVGTLIIGLTDPNGKMGTTTVIIVGGLALLSIIVIVVFGAITAVVQEATNALIYVDLRMRKEGLDLELARFVEARQAGDHSVADPFAPVQQPT